MQVPKDWGNEVMRSKIGNRVQFVIMIWTVLFDLLIAFLRLVVVYRVGIRRVRAVVYGRAAVWAYGVRPASDFVVSIRLFGTVQTMGWMLYLIIKKRNICKKFPSPLLTKYYNILFCEMMAMGKGILFWKSCLLRIYHSSGKPMQMKSTISYT